jgi:hypothetical protein
MNRGFTLMLTRAAATVRRPAPAPAPGMRPVTPVIESPWNSHVIVSPSRETSPAKYFARNYARPSSEAGSDVGSIRSMPAHTIHSVQMIKPHMSSVAAAAAAAAAAALPDPSESSFMSGSVVSAPVGGARSASSRRHKSPFLLDADDAPPSRARNAPVSIGSPLAHAPSAFAIATPSPTAAPSPGVAAPAAAAGSSVTPGARAGAEMRSGSKSPASGLMSRVPQRPSPAAYVDREQREMR